MLSSAREFLIVSLSRCLSFIDIDRKAHKLYDYAPVNGKMQQPIELQNVMIARRDENMTRVKKTGS